MTIKQIVKRLKNRIDTGELGGDQDTRDVTALIIAYERLTKRERK